MLRNFSPSGTCLKQMRHHGGLPITGGHHRRRPTLAPSVPALLHRLGFVRITDEMYGVHSVNGRHVTQRLCTQDSASSIHLITVLLAWSASVTSTPAYSQHLLIAAAGVGKLKGRPIRAWPIRWNKSPSTIGWSFAHSARRWPPSSAPNCMCASATRKTQSHVPDLNLIRLVSYSTERSFHFSRWTIKFQRGVSTRKVMSLPHPRGHEHYCAIQFSLRRAR